MNKKAVILSAVLTALFIALAFVTIQQKENSLVEYVKLYQDMSYKIERDFIENIPIYSDYAKPHMENELMKFNLKAHADQVVKHGTPALKNIQDINNEIAKGQLVSIDTGNENLYYFHNVQKEYRYLTQKGKEGLEIVASRFQEKLQARKANLPIVKIAVSSVIRTVDYQEKLFGRKFVSTHSFGGCFDIFFDDYYVQMPVLETNGKAQEELRKSLHSRTGFLMGDALRRQFKSILMETLLELQREGKIYVFYEKENRCYHITVLIK